MRYTLYLINQEQSLDLTQHRNEFNAVIKEINTGGKTAPQLLKVFLLILTL